MARTGVLLTGFGGPDSVDSCGPFMCNLMGEEPSEELVARVQSRYEAIGGASPLTGIAERIAAALADALDGDIPVRVGMRYWEPYIGEALEGLASEGVERVATVSLSPFESQVATGAYREAVEEAAAGLDGLEVVEAEHLGGLEGYADAHATALADALSGLDWAGYERRLVLFTAHSLPTSDLAEDDAYVPGLKAAVSAVAARAGLGEGSAGSAILPGVEAFGAEAVEDGGPAWLLCFQSKGNRPGEWLGPLIEELVPVAASEGYDAIAVCPVGFLTDHMETLYDLDVVLERVALDAGLGFARAGVPNDGAGIVEAMRALVAPLV